MRPSQTMAPLPRVTFGKLRLSLKTSSKAFIRCHRHVHGVAATNRHVTGNGRIFIRPRGVIWPLIAAPRRSANDGFTSCEATVS
jgi:hypothetical protein